MQASEDISFEGHDRRNASKCWEKCRKRAEMCVTGNGDHFVVIAYSHWPYKLY